MTNHSFDTKLVIGTWSSPKEFGEHLTLQPNGDYILAKDDKAFRKLFGRHLQGTFHVKGSDLHLLYNGRPFVMRQIISVDAETMTLEGHDIQYLYNREDHAANKKAPAKASWPKRVMSRIRPGPRAHSSRKVSTQGHRRPHLK